MIARHYPDAAAAPNPYVALLESVATAQADLIAQWMSLGFIHGVMNTDNTAISGETIDYGPCAFMDAFHPQCVFSSIDSRGRYAWGNQPDIGLWNVTRFAETLLPLLAEDSGEATKIAEAVLSRYPERFGSQYIARFRAKFGLPPEAPVALIQEGLDLLAPKRSISPSFSVTSHVSPAERILQRLRRCFPASEPFATMVRQMASRSQARHAPRRHARCQPDPDPAQSPRRASHPERLWSATLPRSTVSSMPWPRPTRSRRNTLTSKRHRDQKKSSIETFCGT